MGFSCVVALLLSLSIVRSDSKIRETHLSFDPIFYNFHVAIFLVSCTASLLNTAHGIYVELKKKAAPRCAVLSMEAHGIFHPKGNVK